MAEQYVAITGADPDEILTRIPQVTSIHYVASGDPTSVLAVIEASDDEALRLVAEAGFDGAAC